jgi:hypothetical protein
MNANLINKSHNGFKVIQNRVPVDGKGKRLEMGIGSAARVQDNPRSPRAEGCSSSGWKGCNFISFGEPPKFSIESLERRALVVG